MNTCILSAESAETKADSLDAYMKSVGDHLDTTKKLEIKHSLHDLKKVQQKYVEILNNMRDLIIMAQG